jgi:RecJ-like exonuclease
MKAKIICKRCGGSGSLPVEGGGRTCMPCEGNGYVEAGEPAGPISFAGKTEDEIVDELTDRIVITATVSEGSQKSFEDLRALVMADERDAAQTRAFLAMAAVAEELELDEEPQCWVCGELVDEAGDLCEACSGERGDDDEG